MYNKSKSYLKSENNDIESLIEGGDLYNSKFVYILKSLPSQGEYLVVLNKYRIDLISYDIYNSYDYGEIILIYNGITISELRPGVILRSPSIDDLNTLASKLSVISNVNEYIGKINEI